MTTRRNLCNRRMLLPVGVATLGFAMIACAVRAEDKAPTAQTKARIMGTVHSEAVAKLSAKEWRAVSLAAGRILKHTAQARSAIAGERTDEATTHIDKGLTLVQIIENTVPKRKVTAEIKSGDIVYTDEDEVSPALVPIYDELDHVELFTPIFRAKKESVGDDGSKKEGKASGTPEPVAEVVSFEGLEHSTTQLDVLFAKGMLTLAKKEIAEGKTMANNKQDASVKTNNKNADPTNTAKSDPKIVVVSPVRNEERLLPDTIASMVAQTLAPAEWIIVDDGSSDRTAEIVEKAGLLPRPVVET